MSTNNNLLDAVQWKDLLKLNKTDVFSELTLSLPWMIATFVFAYLAAGLGPYLYVLALTCAFMFFLTGLRQVHNAFHFALGIGHKQTHWVMFVLSALMLGSMHAVQINHLRHHQYCMQERDIEAKSARMKWWQALLFGPVFPFLLHHKALKVGTRIQRRWIYAEMLLNIVVLVGVFAILDYKWLQFHFAAMLLGQCMTAFFAVWTVHHDTEDHVYMARTVRHELKRVVTYNMFFHVEHHLFPAVPTRRLHILAKRLDAHAPEVEIRQVF